MASSITPQAHGPGHALERLIFFSDAVFAIAITLLVIEIHVPEIHSPAGDREFLVALWNLTPNFAGFLISFFVIGAFWAGHHRAFDCARHWSPKLIGPNLMLLCAIAAMPFFTAFASEYWSARVPIAFYCGWMVLTALLNIRLQRIATSPPVVGDHVTSQQRTLLRQRGLSVLLGAVTALGVSLFAPRLAQVALVSIFFWRLLIQRLFPAR
jgi:uncharacterized membrane protein